MKIDIFKLVGALFFWLGIILSVLVGGDFQAFIDFPSIFFGVLFPLILFLVLKGKELFIDKEALNLGSGLVVGNTIFGGIIGLVVVLGNISDPGAIGPPMAMVLLSFFWGSLFILSFWVPFTKGEVSLSFLGHPFYGIFITLCSFIFLVFALLKTA